MAQIHWCLGMYASASTWLFNIARAIAETANLQGGYASGFVQSMSDIERMSGLDSVRVAVVKSHETYEGADDWLAPRASSILVTIRDPRDAVASIMRNQKYDFETAIEAATRSANTCARQMSDPRALVLRFEDNFTTGTNTIHRVASAMGYDIAQDAADRIHNSHTRAAVEAKIFELGRSSRILRQVGGPDYLDPETHWHLHHANRDGRIGVWRSAFGNSEVAQIQSRLGPLMEQLNYAPT